MSTSTLYIDNIYNKAGNSGPNFSNGITTTGVNGGQLSGFRNLIINGNFQVNQRGAASITATTSAYNYDRWYYDGTYLYQGVEDKNVFNGTYTLSWQDAGSDITASYVVSTDTTAGDGPDSGQTWTTVSNGGNITVNEATEYSKHLWIRFGGTLSNLSKVQLEMGSTATPFEHRPYGAELALCQRYFEVQNLNLRSMHFRTNQYHNAFDYFIGNHFPFIKKRALPSVTITPTGTLNTSNTASRFKVLNYGGVAYYCWKFNPLCISANGCSIIGSHWNGNAWGVTDFMGAEPVSGDPSTNSQLGLGYIDLLVDAEL